MYMEDHGILSVGLGNAITPKKLNLKPQTYNSISGLLTKSPDLRAGFQNVGHVLMRFLGMSENEETLQYRVV